MVNNVFAEIRLLENQDRIRTGVVIAVHFVALRDIEILKIVHDSWKTTIDCFIGDVVSILLHVGEPCLVRNRDQESKEKVR